jgi:flavodoxin
MDKRAIKTAVIYYSLDGNCALVAEAIKNRLNADVFAIKTADEKRRTGIGKYIWGGRQVFQHTKPELKPLNVNIDAYDLIILGTPVWAGSPAPAMVSFLSRTQLNGKKTAIFCCHGGGKGKALAKFKALLPENAVAAEIDFFNPARGNTEELRKKINAWVTALRACLG